MCYFEKEPASRPFAVPCGRSIVRDIIFREVRLMSATEEFQVDRLRVSRFATREEMGRAAAAAAARKIRELLRQKHAIHVIFAAAPSQDEMLAALVREPAIDWGRVDAFHMDEYVGLAPDAPQGFGNFLRDRIFSKLPFRSVHYIRGGSGDIARECGRYGRLLKEYPPDIVCLGIGENGHIAFNDPAVADFDDPLPVKEVTLDEVCRMQQVHDGCFAALDDVPRTAVTLTVPALTRGGSLFCVVPAATKAGAVRAMLTGPVDESCPASILRRHPDASLYLDNDSAALLPPGLEKKADG